MEIRNLPPASSSKTRILGSSVKREARTQPAVPALSLTTHIYKRSEDGTSAYNNHIKLVEV